MDALFWPLKTLHLSAYTPLTQIYAHGIDLKKMDLFTILQARGQKAPSFFLPSR